MGLAEKLAHGSSYKAVLLLLLLWKPICLSLPLSVTHMISRKSPLSSDPC